MVRGHGADRDRRVADQEIQNPRHRRDHRAGGRIPRLGNEEVGVKYRNHGGLRNVLAF